MMTLLNLFGRSPFTPLQSHMETVFKCVMKIKDLFSAFERQDEALLEVIVNEISDLEHTADLIKNDIRNHLSKALFLPIDQSQLLEILTLQDTLADSAEDVAVLFTLMSLSPNESFYSEVVAFMQKNVGAFESVYLVVKELHELLESSFGGSEAAKVKAMIDHVAFQEHEADLIQRKLLKMLFKNESKMGYATFFLWQKIIETLGAIANSSEKLAYRVRTTLEIKST